MSSATDRSPIIAFFGATGGCANACLAHTLKSGYNAVALARTPSKLTAQLLNQDISQETLDAQLRIVQGDATDAQVVKSTILLSSRQDQSDKEAPNNERATPPPPVLVSHIVSGIGARPVFRRPSPRNILPGITLDNLHVTEQATEALVSALQEIYQLPGNDGPDKENNPPININKPVFVAISAAGLTPQNQQPDDLPFLIRGLLRGVLAVPLADKERMEELIAASRALFRGTVIVRPSLLFGDGTVSGGKGYRNLKVGVESKPAVGYRIPRADVGEWIFEEVIKREGDKWFGEKVTLTT